MHSKRNFGMFNKPFYENIVIKQQKQEHNIDPQTDPLDNLCPTHPIQSGWEISIGPYPNCPYRCILNQDYDFSKSSVATWTQIPSHTREPLLTLDAVIELCDLVIEFWLPWYMSRNSWIAWEGIPHFVHELKDEP
jgi:hypothetical protein